MITAKRHDDRSSTDSGLGFGSALVYGLGITGWSTARGLRARGVDVVVADDRLDDTHRATAAEIGVDVAETGRSLDDLVRSVDVVVPAPGVPETHGVIEAAERADRPVLGELELAYRIEQTRPGGPRPMLAVTGTDGKTTTTLLTVAILEAAGHRAIAAGNTETPLIEALDADVDVFVVECTSFRLSCIETFRSDAGVWLNLAPDHLNWHRSMTTYEAAKARLFELQRPDDVAIGFVDDRTVMRHLAVAPGRRLTFGMAGADYHCAGGQLVGPGGPICDIAAMRRQLPHDITNALAASALALETELADTGAVADALATFVGPPHRLEYVGEGVDVRWFNDSKATTPHAASVALRAFDSVVLIAGGQNKDLDLSPMAAAAGRVRTVVAIGRDADDIAAVFAGKAPVVRADSMDEAIWRAASVAIPGDVVVLSPGCASFDWYTGYEARGDHFRDLVHAHLRPPSPQE